MGASGSAVVITGDVTASEDLTTDGQATATGTIERTDYVLTTGATTGQLRRRRSLRHDKQVVIIERDARTVAKDVSHAALERLECRVQAVGGVEPERRIVIGGDLLDQSRQRARDSPSDRLHPN